ncbi:MAG: outer membrane beta-barrel protein [Saprospiraceae bacterium]|nr:outer membrane beta-barrel protein [Saprospiraceae bacterium]
MKKIILSLTLAVSFLTLSMAQDLHFGFQASPSWSWMGTDNTKINGAGSALGLKLGLIAENRFSEAYSISTGIGFHFNSGGSLVFDLPGQLWKNSWSEFDVSPKVSDTFPKETRLRYSLTFVEIPLGLKMRTPEQGNHIRYFAEPMIALGFRTKAQGAISGATPVVQPQEKINIKADVNGLNLSWGAGVGGEFIVQNNTAIVAGLYFQSGFTDMTGNSGNTLFDSSSGSLVVKPDKSKGTLKSLTVRLGVMF